MAISITDLLCYYQPDLKNKPEHTMGDYDQFHLPFFSGCQCCGASLGPYNAFPSKSGFIRCRDCIDEVGFNSGEEFDEWERNLHAGDEHHE